MIRTHDTTVKPVGVGDKLHDVESGRTATFNPLPTGTGPIPVRPVSADVQLTPIVQPIAMVPYSTQQQPLLMFDEELTYEDENQPVAQPVRPRAKAPEKKKVHAAPLLLILFSLLIVAVYVVGNYVLPEYLALQGTETTGSGLAIIMGIGTVDFSGEFNIEMLLNILKPISVLVVAVMEVIILIASLIGITRKKATVVAKIALILATLFATIALVLLIFLDGGAGAGMYIVTGLCLIAMLLGYLVRAKK